MLVAFPSSDPALSRSHQIFKISFTESIMGVGRLPEKTEEPVSMRASVTYLKIWGSSFQRGHWLITHKDGGACLNEGVDNLPENMGELVLMRALVDYP
jgi:hypothetical protein